MCFICLRHFYITGATSCAGIKNARVGFSDGEYLIYVRPECNTPMKVYCHGMNTSSPKEFITLPAGVQNNYAYIYAKRLPHRPYSARYKCSGTPGRMNYTAAGLSRFRKVRVDLSRMAIIGDDFTFAKSNPFGKRIPYGSAGDCFSMHFGGKCRRGHFKVDLSQTGLRLKPSVRWKAIGFPPGIEMHEYKKSKDGTMVSAKCGGWCGQCRPVGEMLLEQTVCSQEEGVLIDGAFAHKPTPFKIYTKDGPRLSSAPPPPLTSLIFIVFICQESMGNFSEAFRLPPAPHPPLRGFCTLPSLPRRDIQDGGQSRSRYERNVFCKDVCKQSRRCLNS